MLKIENIVKNGQKMIQNLKRKNLSTNANMGRKKEQSGQIQDDSGMQMNM